MILNGLDMIYYWLKFQINFFWWVFIEFGESYDYFTIGNHIRLFSQKIASCCRRWYRLYGSNKYLMLFLNVIYVNIISFPSVFIDFNLVLFDLWYFWWRLTNSETTVCSEQKKFISFIPMMEKLKQMVKISVFTWYKNRFKENIWIEIMKAIWLT